MAWPLVVNAVRHICRYNSVAFLSPAYNFAISQMGGWIQLCASLTDDEIKWRGKDFERFFAWGDQHASWADEPGKIRVECYCAGTFEINNRRNGYELPDVLDAKTRLPITWFRDSLPVLENRVSPILKAIAGGKRAS